MAIRFTQLEPLSENITFEPYAPKNPATLVPKEPELVPVFPLASKTSVSTVYYKSEGLVWNPPKRT